MIDPQLAAAISFIAFGINLFGAVLLLLLNAGSRAVRWYLPFHFCVLLWLFGQAATFTFPGDVWFAVTAFAVAMMPLMFLLFAYMHDAKDAPTWHAYLVLLLAAPLLPIVMVGVFMSELSPRSDLFAWVWSIAGWIGGSLLLWLQGRREARRSPKSPNVRKRVVLLAFVLIAPVSLVGAMLVESAWFIVYGMPIITCWIMFLIFYGVTQMQFYDIEVRVRRSGDIATDTVETERLAVLGQLAATIAHEVRNPLTGVRSLAQRIATEDIGIEKRQQYAQVILEETSRVENLVTNLLDLSKRSALAPATTTETTALAPLFADLALLVASRAEKKQITLHTAAADVTVDAPRSAVTQALLNLLLNAIAHAPDGSMVDLRARTASNGAEITVRDRGTGIPAADRDRIFEPFYTTRSEGTGLGLSVVRHIAREHGWHISVADAQGGGSEFKLVIT